MRVQAVTFTVSTGLIAAALSSGCAVDPPTPLEQAEERVGEVRDALKGGKCLSDDDCGGDAVCDTSSCESCCKPNEICIQACCGTCTKAKGGGKAECKQDADCPQIACLVCPCDVSVCKGRKCTLLPGDPDSCSATM